MTCDHDFRHVNGHRGTPRVTGMDSRSDVVGAAVLAVIVVLVGSPIAITQATGGDPTTGPWWLWWVCYALYVATFLATVWEGETHGPVWRPWVGTAGLVLTGSALYLIGGQGWTAILLVLTAAIAAHVLPRTAVLAVVAVQTLVIPLPSLPDVPTWEIVLGSAIYGGLQLLSVATVWVQLRETRMREELAVANTELRATTALLAETSRTAERLRISRELHDVIGHQLTALALELEVAGHRAEGPAREHVVRARGLAKDLLGDVRSTIGGIRDHRPPLRAALEHVVASLPSPRVHLTVADEVRLDEDRVAAVIRCVQEVVTNTIRHSGAENLWVDVRADGEDAVVRARDDGRGASSFRPGHGLTGMRERFEEVGGTVIFASGDGFRVDARVPAR